MAIQGPYIGQFGIHSSLFGLCSGIFAAKVRMIHRRKRQSYRLYLLFLLILTPIQDFYAQAFTKQEFRDSIQNLPYFTIHKDNYFIAGVPTNSSINSNAANAKYQVSFKQMLTRNALPWDTYLFVTYTQKAFWDVFKESFPFREINFNPTAGIGKVFFDKNDRLKSIASINYEHESNGRDSIFSRSWNAQGTFRPRVYYNPFKKNRLQQYFMLEWYVGHAESLIDYRTFTSMVRIGYVIKSNELNFLKGKP